jgi:OHCU decarboxylase
MAAEGTAPRLTPIDELNRLPREPFGWALRLLFEGAAPLARALYEGRPYRSYEQMLDRSEELLGGLPEEERVAVINAHPRIGEDPAAVRRSSALSYREQGYDRETALDPAEVARVYRELAELNRAYEERFGFRFVVFVAGRPKSAIVQVIRQRLGNPRGEEMATALRDMVLIARDRLRGLATSGEATADPAPGPDRGG